MSVLKISDVTARFGGVTALEDVSFDVSRGELLGLIGPNGAGKTTMLRSITGIVRPDSGRIELNGKKLNDLPIHQRVRLGLAISQQLVRPFREMTLLENVTLAAGYKKTRRPLRAILALTRRSNRTRATELLDLVGIENHGGALPAEVPLGVLKRMEVARALALDPTVLLLDEPLAGLNSNEARILADTVVMLNDLNLTVVLIEHNLSEVMRICERLVVLDNGRKIADGTPKQVMEDPFVRTAYLGFVEEKDAAT